QFTKCTTCQSWCQSPEEKENRRCQECTQIGTSKFIERIEEIEWRKEIKNLNRNLNETRAEILTLRNLVEHYIFNERNIYRNDIKFYDEIRNLYKTRADNTEHYLASTRVAYYNTYLQTIEDQYINLDRSVLHQRELELQQEISNIEELPLPNEEGALEAAIQQNQELLTVSQPIRSKSSLEQRIQEHDE
ncbi:11371_t:CDS:1, partial [Gigaspora rosea]